MLESVFVIAMSISLNKFFDNFEITSCDLCGSELFTFQVSSHAEFHLMMEEDSEDAEES
jgi:hypothetical protein